MSQARDDSGLDKDSSGEGGETWSDSGYILNMKPTGLFNGLDVGDRERQKSGMSLRFLV